MTEIKQIEYFQTHVHTFCFLTPVCDFHHHTCMVQITWQIFENENINNTSPTPTPHPTPAHTNTISLVSSFIKYLYFLIYYPLCAEKSKISQPQKCEQTPLAHYPWMPCRWNLFWSVIVSVEHWPARQWPGPNSALQQSWIPEVLPVSNRICESPFLALHLPHQRFSPTGRHGAKPLVREGGKFVRLCCPVQCFVLVCWSGEADVHSWKDAWDHHNGYRKFLNGASRSILGGKFQWIRLSEI